MPIVPDPLEDKEPSLQFIEGLSLKMGNQRNEKIIEMPQHDVIEAIKGQVDPVIADPALGEIIGPNPFAPVTASHLALPVSGNLVVLLLLFHVQQPGLQHLQGLGAIFML